MSKVTAKDQRQIILESDPNEIYKASKDADIISRYLIGDNEMKKDLIDKHTSVKKDKEVER